jgi:hypothetical protein
VSWFSHEGLSDVPAGGGTLQACRDLSWQRSTPRMLVAVAFEFAEVLEAALMAGEAA